MYELGSGLCLGYVWVMHEPCFMCLLAILCLITFGLCVGVVLALFGLHVGNVRVLFGLCIG